MSEGGGEVPECDGKCQRKESVSKKEECQREGRVPGREGD